MNTMQWGTDPEFSGPRDWYRNSLIISQLPSPHTGELLDFGAGSGNLVIRLASLGYKCTAVDISASAIAFIRQKTYQYQVPIQTVRSGPSFFNRNYRRFSVIVCGETLEHLRDDFSVVRRFYLNLHSGGICIASVPAHPKRWDINDDYSSHFRRYTRKQVVQLFKQSGFSEVRTFYWGFPLGFIWHRLFYLPLIRRKLTHGITFTRRPGVFSRILSYQYLKKILSGIFYVDSLFNWTTLGDGLIVIAKK